MVTLLLFTGFSYPQINGDKKFVKLINKTIVLLEQWSPETYNYLMSVDEINCAETGNYLALAIWGDKNIILLPFEITIVNTKKDRVYSVAGILAHESWHIINKSVDQRGAFEYQYNVLVTIGAPDYIIKMPQCMIK